MTPKWNGRAAPASTIACITEYLRPQSSATSPTQQGHAIYNAKRILCNAQSVATPSHACCHDAVNRAAMPTPNAPTQIDSTLSSQHGVSSVASPLTWGASRNAFIRVRMHRPRPTTKSPPSRPLRRALVAIVHAPQRIPQHRLLAGALDRLLALQRYTWL